LRLIDNRANPGTIARMAVSERARAILDEIERDRAARRSGGAGTQPPAIARPVTPPPAAAGTVTPPPAPVRAGEVIETAADPGRILELVSNVATQAAQVRTRLQSLEEALDLVALTIGMPVGTQGATAPSRRRGRQEWTPPRPLEPVPAEAAQPAARPSQSPPEARPSQPTGPIGDSARLVAVEMAVAGYSRDEVERRLANEFGIADPQPVLDDVFGAGTPGTSRMPWS
jgi:hypothetical protein